MPMGKALVHVYTRLVGSTCCPSIESFNTVLPSHQLQVQFYSTQLVDRGIRPTTISSIAHHVSGGKKCAIAVRATQVEVS